MGFKKSGLQGLIHTNRHTISLSRHCHYFVLDQARIRNDPAIQLTNRAQPQLSAARERSGAGKSVTVNKNTFEEHHGNELSNEKKLDRCPIHKSKHSLSDCRTFQQKPHEEKWKLLKNLKLCFKCLRSTKHQGRSCPEGISCQKCGKDHSTVMHMDQGGENAERREPVHKDNVTIESKCTKLCGEYVKGKSCAKIVLIRVYRKDNPEDYQSCYAIIDEQSNHTLVKPELFTLLGLGGEQIEYSLASCSGLSVTTGRKADGLVIESFDGTVAFDLPTVIECLDIPCNRDEIPSPSVAACHPHLSDVAQYIPEIDEHIKILMLIGRDITDVHHVLDQRTGPLGSPFAQQLPLGWVIIGEVCLGDKHVTSNVSVNKTFVVGDGRASLLPPCTSKFHLTESIDHDVNNIVHNCNNTYVIDNGRHTVFKSCSNLQNLDHVFTYHYVFGVDVRDNEPSLSFEDRDFLSLMDDKFVLNSENRWSAPLPFKASRPRLPCNKGYALQRAKSLQVSLNKDPAKKQHFVEFMGKLLTNGHAERAQELLDDAECWYLPIFGVYHPKKPNKIRVVFDSAAQFEGVSLNSVLLQGPDLTNSLLGVLLRFRREKIAISVDVEQMFYCFGVCERDRDYLRFFWHEENDTSKPLVQYRMCKHVFGNSPSPAIATYGLRKAVESADSDVKQFVQRDFYVDDGLTSVPSVTAAQDLIKRTKASLAVTGLHLHKITSNAPEVLKGFSKEDLATDLNCLDFDHESLPTQRSLGLGWDLNQDRFVFSNECYDKPVTKRGILTAINSVFDPLGFFLAPVLIEGRLLMREVVSSGVEWDEPLHQDLEAKWNLWLSSLKDLSSVEIKRSLFEVSLSTLTNLELHIFSDASEKAIAAVVYIVGCSSDGSRYVSFVMGKAKVAPSKGHTIPRLELSAAVLATELYMLVSENLGVDFAQTSFYTDSKVVLGYIGNQSRRFYTYVSNRTQKIRRVSSPQQWKYIKSEYNPADLGSRGLSPLQLKDSVWLLGPAFLSECIHQVPEFYPMVNPDFDNEVRQNVVTRTTNVQSKQSLGIDRFERFSSWTKLLLSVGVLLHVVMSFRKATSCAGWHICSKSSSTECRNLAKVLVLREVQYGSFKAEIHALIAQSPIQANSPLSLLDPFIDDDGLIRVGGRLRQSSLPIQEKHPVILPCKSHVTKLVVRHYHESVLHQGRSFTEGALRQDGYWIIGSKRAVSSCIFNCVPFKKLRGRFEHQKMADLPADRIEQETPFSHVGVDVFGPWQVVSRRTRSSQASSKRWGVLFTCLVVRAIHIEVVDEMSTSAFINALRRFIAIRGKVKIFRSDRGTNFVGATDLIGVDALLKMIRLRIFLETMVVYGSSILHIARTWEGPGRE